MAAAARSDRTCETPAQRRGRRARGRSGGGNRGGGTGSLAAALLRTFVVGGGRHHVILVVHRGGTARSREAESTGREAQRQAVSAGSALPNAAAAAARRAVCAVGRAALAAAASQRIGRRRAGMHPRKHAAPAPAAPQPVTTVCACARPHDPATPSSPHAVRGGTAPAVHFAESSVVTVPRPSAGHARSHAGGLSRAGDAGPGRLHRAMLQHAAPGAGGGGAAVRAPQADSHGYPPAHSARPLSTPTHPVIASRCAHLRALRTAQASRHDAALHPSTRAHPVPRLLSTRTRRMSPRSLRP